MQRRYLAHLEGWNTAFFVRKNNLGLVLGIVLGIVFSEKIGLNKWGMWLICVICLVVACVNRGIFPKHPDL